MERTEKLEIFLKLKALEFAVNEFGFYDPRVLDPDLINMIVKSMLWTINNPQQIANATK